MVAPTINVYMFKMHSRTSQLPLVLNLNCHECARHPLAVQNAFAHTLLAKACH
jgi:hypothetical protein